MIPIMILVITLLLCFINYASFSISFTIFQTCVYMCLNLQQKINHLFIITSCYWHCFTHSVIMKGSDFYLILQIFKTFKIEPLIFETFGINPFIFKNFEIIPTIFNV